MLIHGFVAHSRVNGPGMRAVVYFQGCNLGCAGCWNPGTHAFIGPSRGICPLNHKMAATAALCFLKAAAAEATAIFTESFRELEHLAS
jgi:pyruvate-formate lyase-activating enzyme